MFAMPALRLFSLPAGKHATAHCPRLQASSERNEIEREMNKLMFERLAASDGAVLHSLTEEMSVGGLVGGWVALVWRSPLAACPLSLAAPPGIWPHAQLFSTPLHLLQRQSIRECFLGFCALLSAGKDLQGEAGGQVVTARWRQQPMERSSCLELALAVTQSPPAYCPYHTPVHS